MEAGNVLIQSLDIANKRINTLETKYSKLKEKNKKQSKKLKEVTKICDEMTVKANELIDGVKNEKTMFSELVNGIFKKLVIIYGERVELKSQKVLVYLGKIPDSTPYFAKIELTNEKKYIVGSYFDDSCFRYFDNCKECGCCIVNTIDEVLVKVNELDTNLSGFLTPEKVTELRQVQPTSIANMLRDIIGQISGGGPIDIIEYPINF